MDLSKSYPNEGLESLQNSAEEETSTKLIGHACRGFHEIFSLEMWRAAFTELIGTACLVFALTTAIISCLESHEAAPKHVIPVFIFVIVFLILLVTVPLSGGHLNPIFTIIAVLEGVITSARALAYILAQCLGSLVAGLLMKGVMSRYTIDKYLLGGCVIDGTGVSASTALIVEFICTFLVLFAAVTTAFDKQKAKELGLTMVCVVVAATFAIVVFLSTTMTDREGYGGAGLNPARCLGPALILRSGSLWNGLWVFWVGPVLACVVYYAFTLTLPREGFVRFDEEHDVLKMVVSSVTCFNKKTKENLHV